MHTANVKKYALLQDKSLYHLLKTLLLSPAVRLLQAECNKKKYIITRNTPSKHIVQWE